MRFWCIPCSLLFCCGGTSSTLDSGAPDATAYDSADVDSGENPDSGSPCAPNMDFSSDALNCGACGKSCLGGACTSGKCGPVEIAADNEKLVADGTGVYWANQGTQQANFNDGAVRFVGLNATKPTDLFTGSAPVDVTVDANKLYFVTLGVWANNTFTGGTAYSCPKTGCMGMPQALGGAGDGFNQSPEIANNAQNVYWTNRTSNLVMTVSKSGGPATKVSSGIGVWLRATDTNLYMTYSMQLNRVALPMGMLTTIATAPGLIRTTCVAANAIFWVSQLNGGGQIQMCPLPDCSGGAQPLFNSDDTGFQALAVDNDTLFFSERGALTSCKVSSCATTKVTLLPQPMKFTIVTFIAVASGVIYYAWGDGSPHISRMVL